MKVYVQIMETLTHQKVGEVIRVESTDELTAMDEVRREIGVEPVFQYLKASRLRPRE